MVPVNGEPFVARQLRLLAREGVTNVVFCLGHHAQPLIDFVADGAAFGLHVSYSFDGDVLRGTAGAVAAAVDVVQALAPTSDTAARIPTAAVDVVQALAPTFPAFAVLYGDSYLDVPYGPIYRAFLKSGKPALMTVYRNDNELIKSNILYRDGAIVAYDKSASAPAEMAHVDFGLSFYQRQVFAHIDELPCDLSTVTQALIERSQLAGYEVPTRFYEVGTPEGVRDLEAYLAEHRP